MKSLVKKCVAFYVSSLLNAECNRITVESFAGNVVMPCGDVKGQRKRIRIEKIHIFIYPHPYLRVTLLMRPNLATGETFSVVLSDFSTFLLV